eukprot:2162589-Heterocapsa_arctica.AAC.1
MQAKLLHLECFLLRLGGDEPHRHPAPFGGESTTQRRRRRRALLADELGASGGRYQDAEPWCRGERDAGLGRAEAQELGALELEQLLLRQG